MILMERVKNQAGSKLMPRRAWQGRRGMVDYRREIQGDSRPHMTCEQIAQHYVCGAVQC